MSILHHKKEDSNQSIHLSSLTWQEYALIAQSNPIIIMPFGAIEQHGPHLPLATDALLSMKIAEELAKNTKSYVVESFIYGMRSDIYSGGGENFLGTCSLSPETFLKLGTDILEELCSDGFKHFLLLNGHFENASLIREVSRRITKNDKSIKILFCNWWDIPPRPQILKYFPKDFPGMDLEHAGLLETSLMLHCFPELVRDKDLFPNKITFPPGYELYPEKLNGDVGHFGALAPAANASAEIGKEIFKMVISGLSEHLNLKLRN